MLLYVTLLIFVTKSTLTADLNVGTVLFTKADQYKECWSSENLALLTSRMILEDLLPSTSVLVIDSNEFITDLVEYFRLILETVRQQTHGKTKHITLTALTDLLGGYLHHAVLPIAKYAYYAGLIDYDSMATLLGLFDELKWFLRTNGQGWAKPVTQNLENFEIQKIPLQPCNDKEVCDNLMLVEGETDRVNEMKTTRCDLTIPLPFFDSLTQPNAIALPTKSCSLHSVEANSSSYLVMNFFVRAYKCLQVKNAKLENVEKFQNDFCAWIEEQIMPRLEDERFYSAFGGILRVRDTIKRLGVTQNNVNKQVEDFQETANDLIQNTNKGTSLQRERPMSRSSMILMAVLITISVWFFLGTLFICYKMKRSNKKDTDSLDGDGEKKTTTTDNTSLTSSKNFFPEPPRVKSKVDKKGYKGQHRHEITIKTCHCHDREEEGEMSTTRSATTEATPIDNKLPSITEISEQSSTVKGGEEKRDSVQSVDKEGSSATSNGGSRRVSHLKLFEDTTSETEESSPE